MEATCVWERINAFAPKIPNSATSSQQQKQRKIAVPVTRFASSGSFLPKARDTRVLTPTPVPVARPIMMFCAGNASESAERQSSETRAT